MFLLRRAALALVFAIGVVGSASADDTQLSAFYGTFRASALTEKLERLPYGVTTDDLDIEVVPTASGFTIAWTAVSRESADPTNTNVRRQPVSIAFVPSGHSSSFRAAGPLEAKIGAQFAWAHISGQTLSLSLATMDERGAFELQTYDWTLTDLGLQLESARVRNGEQSLLVRARLVKASK